MSKYRTKPEQKAKQLIDDYGKQKALERCAEGTGIALGVKSTIKYWKSVKTWIEKL